MRLLGPPSNGVLGFLGVLLPKPQNQKVNIVLFKDKIAWNIISIKHDLARSCFQLWPKIGDEGDKISKKIVPLGADFEGHN